MKKTILTALILSLIPLVSYSMPGLQVSENNRYLKTEDGKPFFWLGETAWWMTFKLRKKEIAHYFKDRKEKGYTVIQGPCALWYHSGKPNATEKETWYGNVAWENAENLKPFVGGETNVDEPNEAYWQYYDYIVETAEDHGLYLMFVTLWEQHVALFTVEQHYALGRFLGERYKHHSHLIWSLGGEVSSPKTVDSEKLASLARGIEEGRKGGVQQIVMMHSSGVRTSHFYHAESFNQINNDQEAYGSKGLYEHMWKDWDKEPTKPTFVIETSYEGVEGVGAFETRRAAYCSVFAGGIGFGYGANAVWQFWRGGGDPDYGSADPVKVYREEMEYDGAKQMEHLKNLIMERPNFFDREPKQALLLSVTDDSLTKPIVCTDNKEYVMVYIPDGKAVEIDTSVLKRSKLRIRKFNPRNGEYIVVEAEIENAGSYVTPDLEENDWVVLIEKSS